MARSKDVGAPLPYASIVPFFSVEVNKKIHNSFNIL